MLSSRDLSQRPLVVVCNDDGVDAPGLRLLAAKLSERFEVLVVAPTGECSGTGHAFTMSAKWLIWERGPMEFAVEGTPADCVYLAVHQLAPRPPSLVVSGVNPGFNLGTDVFYSGTVAAAAEATIHGVPGIAVSTESTSGPGALDRAVRFAVTLASWVLASGWGPRHTLVNVNVPAEGDDGFRVGALGIREYPRPERSTSPVVSGKRFSLHRHRVNGTEGCSGEDAAIVRAGHIAVTPLVLDMTHREELGRLHALRLDGFE